LTGISPGLWAWTIFFIEMKDAKGNLGFGGRMRYRRGPEQRIHGS
jgi:hypothetical protein